MVLIIHFQILLLNIMNQQEFHFTTKTKLKLYAKAWLPEEQPKATICLVHGLGEHINRYNHVAAYFTFRDYAMLGFDNRGFGQSEGKKGHALSVEEYLEGIEYLIAESRKRFPNTPIFLYGHSMGGNLVLNYLIRKNPDIRGVIASAPFITTDNPPASWLIAIAKFMKNIAPGIRQDNGLNLADLSTDPKVIETYKADPLVHPHVTFGGAVTLFAGADYLVAYEGGINVPLLIMHGSADKITSPNGSKRFAKNVKGDITLKIWDGMFHEIHNEPDQKQVFDEMATWMKVKLEV